VSRLRRRQGDAGFTLVELLMASGLMVIVISALVTALLLAVRTSVGLNPKSTVAKQDTSLISTQIEAHIGIQSLSRYFTADIDNADNPSDVKVMGDSPAPSVTCTRPTPDPTLGSSGEIALAQIKLRDTSGSVTDTVTYVYSRDTNLHFGQIARYDCAAAGGNASAIIVARGLSTATLPSSVHTAPTQSVPSHIFTIIATTVAGRTYTVDATPAVDVSQPNGGGGAGVTPPIPFTSIKMQDVGANGTTQNGKVDRVVVSYDSSVTIGAGCNTGWSLSGAVPSGGTLGAPVVVSNASHTITLPIVEGSGAADTSVGSLAVNFNPAASCSLLGFANLVPIDDAAPVVVAVTVGPQPKNAQGVTTGAVGKMEPGDSVSIQFSEPLDPTTVPAAVTVTEKKVSSTSDTLAITSASLNLTNAPVALGTGTYFSSTASTGATASYPANVTTDSPTAPTVLTVTIPATVLQNGNQVVTPCTGTPTGAGNGCINLAAGTSTAVAFTPATTILSLAAPPSSTSSARAATTVTVNPPPGAGFRMF
jgi:hypothetical protein